MHKYSTLFFLLPHFLPFFAAPIARIFIHEQSESHIVGHDRIETAQFGQIAYLEIRIHTETLLGVGYPVIIDKLAEVSAGKLADRPRNIDLIAEYDTYDIVDCQTVIKKGLLLLEILHYAVVKLAVSIFPHAIGHLHLRYLHRLHYLPFMIVQNRKERIARRPDSECHDQRYREQG